MEDERRFQQCQRSHLPRRAEVTEGVRSRYGPDGPGGTPESRRVLKVLAGDVMVMVVVMSGERDRSRGGLGAGGFHVFFAAHYLGHEGDIHDGQAEGLYPRQTLLVRKRWHLQRE